MTDCLNIVVEKLSGSASIIVSTCGLMISIISAIYTSKNYKKSKALELFSARSKLVLETEKAKTSYYRHRNNIEILLARVEYNKEISNDLKQHLMERLVGFEKIISEGIPMAEEKAKSIYDQIGNLDIRDCESRLIDYSIIIERMNRNFVGVEEEVNNKIEAEKLRIS
ncbi:hypothetical protein [Comamonas aquatica]|uniref:hypothetical protein n=1 Tax=Comamonas aquatica TaxID=225991 RepID=UPI0034D49F05